MFKLKDFPSICRMIGLKEGGDLKSKLLKLYDDETFGVDAISFNNGFVINSHDDLIDYMILEYQDRFDVYLNLYDHGEPPYRNILVKGSSKSLDVARNIALRKLDKEAYGHLN